VAGTTQILRLLENEVVSSEAVLDLKDMIDDYLERNQDDFDDFAEVDEIYESLGQDLTTPIDVVPQ
jgi:CCR4-NOT transcription complex subunit 3